MKKYLLWILGSFTNLLLMAQARPAYTQYILNNYIINPAISGIENYTDVKLSYRNQWNAIPGAPVTSYASVQMPLNKTDLHTSATSFDLPGNDPRGQRLWEEYTPPDAHHGIGFIGINDKAGYINKWTIAASYAYHKPLSTKTTLALGFTGGMSAINLDRTQIDWANLDPNDPAIGISNGELKKIVPELGAGLWLYSARYFIGASVLNIIPGSAKFSNASKYGTYYTPNYFATAGYRFTLSDDISMIPSAMVQYWQPQLLGIHTNLKFQYQDKFWLGGSYRFSDLVGGYSAMAGLNILNFCNLSYSYEVATTSRLRTFTGNTNEIMLGFILGNKYSQKCPRCF